MCKKKLIQQQIKYAPIIQFGALSDSQAYSEKDSQAAHSYWSLLITGYKTNAIRLATTTHF